MRAPAARAGCDSAGRFVGQAAFPQVHWMLVSEQSMFLSFQSGLWESEASRVHSNTGHAVR